MRRMAFKPALAAALVLVVGACDESDSVTDAGPVGPEPEALAPSDTFEPALEIEHGVHTLTFLDDGDGVAVAEYGPVDAPPLLDAFAAEDATALEILRAVSPSVNAPAALGRPS